MQFSFTPTKVTKELLLNNKSEEEYMSFYLGIVPDKDMHCNPLRDDKNPTASFYRSKSGELIFKDWKTNFHANFVDIVMSKFGVTYVKALNIIANDFNIIKKPHYEKHEAAVVYKGEVIEDKGETVIQAEVQEWSDVQLQWWQTFGISQATLKKYDVHSVKNVFLNGNFAYNSTAHNPIYGYYFGKDEGRELWKMYFPFKRKYRFLLNTNKLQGVKQLPKTGDVLVITKSLKDVMVLHEMGVAAIAPQAESIIITSRQYQALAKRFKRIIFNGDWDGAGQLFMIKSRRKYPSICLSFREKGKYGKDVSDFVKKYGFEKAQKFIRKVEEAVMSGHYDRQLKYCKSE